MLIFLRQNNSQTATEKKKHASYKFKFKFRAAATHGNTHYVIYHNNRL